jgi:putative spermidine/putrescine transport system permease protein
MNELSGSDATNRRLIAIAAWLCYLFLLVPSLIVIPISFGNPEQIEFPPHRFSLELYRQFFTDAAWWGSMVQSLVVATLTTLLGIVVAVPAAYALVRSRLPGRKVLHGLFLLPMLVPVIVLGLGLYIQFARWGWLDTTPGLVLSHIMLTTPFIMVSVLSGLRHADVSLETVASIMGASQIVVFFRVVLPQLKVSIAIGAMFAFLMSLDEVVVAYFITSTNSMTLPVKMYSAIRWEISPVLAAVSTLLTLVSLMIAVGISVLQRKTEVSS